MNEAHIHLILNHIPILFPIVAGMVLIIGFFTKSELLKRTSYFILIISSIIAIPTFSSGEEAEEIVEELPQISHRIIHIHEELAEKFILISHLTGLIALFALWASWKKKAFATWNGIILLICIIALSTFGVLTGNSGGDINHPEFNLQDAEHEAHE